jgi:Flp pilus assembly protein TadD
MSLNDLAIWLAEAGRSDEAVQARLEAAQLQHAS